MPTPLEIIIAISEMPVIPAGISGVVISDKTFLVDYDGYNTFNISAVGISVPLNITITAADIAAQLSPPADYYR